MDLNMEIAWNTINLISIEYNYMWDKIDKLELLLYQQQNVIAQLLSAVIESECQYENNQEDDDKEQKDDDQEEFEDFETNSESDEEFKEETIKNKEHLIDQNSKLNLEDLKINEINLDEKNQIFTSNDYVQFREHSIPIISENDFENLNQIDSCLKCKLILSNEILSNENLNDGDNIMQKSNLISILPKINDNISQLNTDLIKNSEKEFSEGPISLADELSITKIENDQFYISTDNFRRPTLTKEATIYVDSFDHNYQTNDNLENKEIALEENCDNEVSKNLSNDQCLDEINISDKKADTNNQLTTINQNQITKKELFAIEKINKEVVTKRNRLDNENHLLNKQNSKPEESSIFSSITNSMFQSYQNVMNRSIFKKESQSLNQNRNQVENKSPIRNIFGGFKSFQESMIKKEKFPISGGGPQLSLPDMFDLSNSEMVQVEKKILIESNNDPQTDKTNLTYKEDSKKNEKLSHRTQSMLEANTMLDELKKQNDSNDHLKIILEKSFSTESAIFTNADSNLKSNSTLPELKENDQLDLPLFDSPLKANDNKNFDIQMPKNEILIDVCLENGQRQKEQEDERNNENYENSQIILESQQINNSNNETKSMINKIKNISTDISLDQFDDKSPKTRKKTKWIAAVVIFNFYFAFF